MKTTSQKILLTLLPINQPNLWLSTQILPVVVPEISASGQRSLLLQLKRKGWVTVERWGQGTHLRSTQQAQSSVKAHFPALSEVMRAWEGDWTAIHFLSAPPQDLNFRYLRTLLLQTRAVPLSRGLYIYPGILPRDISNLCDELYQHHVFRVRWGEVIQGDIISLISSTYALSDIQETYSGISKEVSSLLRKKQPLSDLNDQQKKSISLVFDRFFTALIQDPGIAHFYYPHMPDPLSILGEIQELLAVE